MQCHRKQAHAELKWVPSGITVEDSFALIKMGGGEGDASKQSHWGLPSVSLVSCIPDVSGGNGNQVGPSGGARVFILEAKPTDNLKF